MTRTRRWTARASNRLHYDGRAVRENLSDSGRDFVGVVADTDDRIGACIRPMGDHELESIVSRALAEFGVERDVSADERLQSRANRADDAPRANDDAAYQAQVPDDALVRELECGRHEPGVECHAVTSLCTLPDRPKRRFNVSVGVGLPAKEDRAAQDEQADRHPSA